MGKRTTGKRAKAIKVHGYRIRERRPGCWVLQVRRKGIKPLFETFHSEEAARLRCVQLHREQTRNGLSAFEIDTKDRTDATEAIKILGGRISLADAARFWSMHHPDHSTTTIAELRDQYLADLTRRKCRPRTLQDNRHRLGKLAADYGDRAACTITTAEILQWLELRGGGPVNCDNFRRVFRAAFNFARKRGIMTFNPADAIEAIQADDAMPEHWPASKVETLLRNAQAFAPSVLPYFALQAFAGLRPDEAAGLRWENVNLPERSIRIMPKTSKTRTARIADIPDNLAAWLAAYTGATGKIAPAPSTLTRWRGRLIAAAVLGTDEVRARLARHAGKKGTAIMAEGIGWRSIVADAKGKSNGEAWPQDVLRHSYATHWLPLYHEKAKLAALMGNSPEIIDRHYKALATAKEAAAYFAIMPEKTGRLIEMKRAG